MNGISIERAGASRWFWVVLGTGVVMIFAALYWSNAQTVSSPKPAGFPDNIEHTSRGGRIFDLSYAVITLPPINQVTPDTRVRIVTVDSNQLNTNAMLGQDSANRPITKTADKKSASVSIKNMFPVGNITSGIPYVSFPGRQPPELFPSFVYGGKMWTPTGLFARQGQIDLAPTGFKLMDGRKLYALSNTTGTGKVLFIQSGRYPDKYAIYRS